MTYERLNLTTGDLLDSDVFGHLEDGIENAYNKTQQIFEDLYNGKVTIYDEVEYSTTDDVYSPIKFREFKSSTFQGWCACIGKPSKIDKLLFPIKARSGQPIETISITLLKLPDISEMSFTGNKNGVSLFTPVHVNWASCYTQEITFKKPITNSSSYTVVEVDFPDTFINTDEKYLMLKVFAPVQISVLFEKRTFDDIEFNPWSSYSSGGGWSMNYATNNIPYIYDSKDIECWPVQCLVTKSTSADDKIIDTALHGKFFNLVEEAMSNSSTMGNILDPIYTPKYADYGSQNLFTNASTNTISLTSTFSGVLFPIGVVNTDLLIEGVRLKIIPRYYNGVSNPATKVKAYLYTVNNIPYQSKSYTFYNLGATLLSEGVSECEIEVGKSGIVDIFFDTPYQNSNGKFMMLGYKVNTYFHKASGMLNLKDNEMCSILDGNYYEEPIDTYYTTVAATDDNPNWSRVWRDQPAMAYSLFTTTKTYGLGENFKKVVEDAVSKMDIKVEIPEQETTYIPSSEVRLAKQYDLVVGDTFQLFHTGIIKSFMPEAEGVNIICSKGYAYPRHYEWTPTSSDVGSYTLKAQTRNFDGTIVSEGTTTLVVHPKLTNDTTPSNLNILCFGDSLTAGGQWPAEGLRRIYGKNGLGASGPSSLAITNKVNAYGRKTATVNTYEVKHEGYGGWTWASFLATSNASVTTNGIIVTLDTEHGYDLDTLQKTIWVDNNGLLWELEDFPNPNKIKFNRGEGNNGKQSATSLPTSLTCESLSITIVPSNIIWESGNPFYDEETSRINFITHAQECGSEGADIVACLLTWNGGGSTTDGSFNFKSKIDTHLNGATTLLRKIHDDLPNAKIIVLGIQISSLTGGCAANYGSNGGYADMWGTAFYAFDYNQAIEELVTNDEFSEYCYYVDTKGQFDTIYCMPYYETVNVNTRVTSKKILRGSNGVHPNTEGYYQIGDAFYRALTKVIPIVKQIKESN